MTTHSIDGKTQLPQKERLFTLNFILIFFCTFAFFFSMHLLLPTLPLYVVAIGGKESELGLVTAAFTFSAVMLRPPIGQAVDARGKKAFILVGAGIFVISPILYIVANTIPWLLGLRLFHGMGIAAFTTAIIALVADISPVMRRGEAMGYFGIASDAAMALAPPLGVVVMTNLGFTPMFLVALGFASLALLLASLVSDPHRAAAHPVRQLSVDSFLSRPALFPSLLVFCLTVTFGVVTTFLPVYVMRHELGNPGLLFTVFATVKMITRPIAGLLSDAFGRKTIILPGMLAVVVSMALLATVPSFAVLVTAAVFYGLGFGSVHPTLLAWVADRVQPEQRGAAMATFTTAFDLGIGLSAVGLGFVLELAGFATMWALAGGVALLGFALALPNRQKRAGD